MKNDKLRLALPLIVFVLIAIGYAAYAPIGTLSAFGWGSISLLCPVGALAAMLAAKSLVPRAVIALVIAVVIIVVAGRAFCGWICPVPVVSKLRTAFSKKSDIAAAQAAQRSKLETDTADIVISQDELDSLKACSRGCGTCASKTSIDSRHIVLGGALLSSLVFGFPVFCLVCPIGLSFATVFLIISLFGAADVTWTVVAIPVLLLIEVVFFRKWCTHICPVSALMSLISKANRTFEPTVDQSKCLENVKGVKCGVCSKVCDQGINPRHPERGNNFSECTKCHKCVEACPGHALSMPFLPKSQAESLPAESGKAADAE